MEDWQEWQVRADQIASSLGSEIDQLVQTLDQAEDGVGLRAFWTRFRQLKESVRTAPAIKLEDKLHLERRLREAGSRAYKAQEAAMAQSTGRKDELLPRIQELLSAGEKTDSPQMLRDVRRNLDTIRKEFDAGAGLVPADRQAVWDAWRDASQFVWQRLTEIWESNETRLREVLTEARQQVDAGDSEAARRSVSRFFDQLKSHEGRQNTVTSLKSEANEIRNSANRLEENRATQRAASIQAQHVPAVEGWKTELERNKDSIARLTEEVQSLEKELQDTSSILEQAMMRGPLVDKKKKLSDLERSNRALEQRIEQSEAAPMILSA